MKQRLDVLMVEQGFAPSREKAKAILMSGIVYVNGQKEDKAGTFFDPSKCTIEVRGKSLRYVSRGGLKLEKAMQVWEIPLEGRVCMDIGASTGGFTDCMLQNGAEKVYAIDVGQNQLDWKLRNHERVVVMEQTNFRFLTPGDLPESPEFASCDVSFISLTKILIPARNLLSENGRMVVLVKPQFEAGREKVGKGGIVREPETHREVLRKVVCFARMIGFSVLGLEVSPIHGTDGNIEYLCYLEKQSPLTPAQSTLTEGEAEKKLIPALERFGEEEEERALLAEIDSLVERSHAE
ncbi:MAG: TlyA family RNA methyltransferase [Lachnospiraceae bacterium]|nr:TlyA family RNA methyltransferase [Lachnospiraceae bacterium]